MTTAVITQRGNEYSITINGHAGYSDGGPDIVCAACSVLTCTLMQCAFSEEAAGNLKELSTAEYSGDVLLRLTASDHAAERISAIVDTIASGFAMLAHTYPENVRLSVRTGEK